jgi:hypothetical protein
MKRLFLLLLLSGIAAAQAVHLSGGQSTVQNLEGGGATFYLEGDNALYIGGGRGLGVSDKFDYETMNWVLGDSAFSYSVDGAGTSIYARGLNISKTTQNRTIGGFVGLTGISYTVPFFSSLQEARYPGVGFYIKQTIGKWHFESLDIFSRQKTLIQSFRFDGTKLQFYGNGGIIQNRWQAGGAFMLTPIKGIGLSGSDVHQLNLKGDNIAAYANSKGIQVHGSATWSQYNHRESHGLTVGAGWSRRWIQVRSDWYKTAGQHAQFVNSLIETTRHWMLTEAINNGNQFQYGAAFHNNSLQLSFNHTIQFLPGLGYESVLSVGIGFKIHDSQVNSQEYLLPGNHFKYSAYADQWLQGPLQAERSGHQFHKEIGKYLIQGAVVREDGSPVEGAAVSFNEEILYTDRNGIWQYRSKKQLSHPKIDILVDEFLCSGTFQVVSQSDNKIVLKQIS